MTFRLLLVISNLLFTPLAVHALSITGAGLSNTTIPFETAGTPTGTTVQFTLDGPANVAIDVFRLDTFSRVAVLSQNGAPAGAVNIFWNGLWLLGGDLGRQDGNYQFVINASSSGGTASFTLPTLLQITSVDIHNVSVSPSFDADHQPSFPYSISYALAKESLTTVQIKNAAGSVVRTLISNAAQFGEATSTNTLAWDGLADNGHPVPLGVYTIVLNAKDPANSDQAITRTRTTAVGSLASLNVDPQKLFEDNAFVFPNPVRGSQATFQAQAVRDGASLSFKIYTLAGDLVREQTFDGVAPGNLVTFAWDTTNQAGKKVGHGLYYYAVRENDAAGALQTVKKLAVIR